MNKDAYAKQVIAVLNSSLDSIGPDAARKLQSARERACSLAAQQSQSHQFRSAHSLAWSDWMRQHRTGLVGMLLVIVLCATAAIWQTSFSNNDDDTAAIDTELLTGDLPVNAYLDGHLSKWVNNSSD